MGRPHRQVATVAAPVRCAVYCRKSTDAGLEKDFNSLDSQRFAAESYIASQQHAGWTVLPERYDDGGFSGGTTERPALKRLLGDVVAGRIDAIVVYRLDRLSRSLVDFGRLHELLEKHSVALVSVTESINTSTPHGRMMVNVLLSFAQYERELGSERTRDKIHAARQHGKWTGGMPVLGYDSVKVGNSTTLAVNEVEAAQVRSIFALYSEERSLIAVVEELNRRGWRMKSWMTRKGKHRQGSPWNKRSLHPLLRNPLYAGLQRLGDRTFPGDHPAIVPKDTWNAVQRILDGNRLSAGADHRNSTGALLRGLLWCGACGRQMTHTWTRGRHGNGKAYRFYRCGKAVKQGASACPTRSVPAAKIEDVVVAQVARIGADPELRRQTFQSALAQVAADRRGLKAEARRLERDLAAARTELDGLVRALATAEGSAATALQEAVAAAQERVAGLQARVAEVREREAALACQVIDEADLGRALEEFTGLWEVLATPERERVIRLVLERVTYRAEGETEIKFALPGLAELAEETA
jgi:site-specific DNA recombinase